MVGRSDHRVVAEEGFHGHLDFPVSCGKVSYDLLDLSLDLRRLLLRDETSVDKDLESVWNDVALEPAFRLRLDDG